jgi:histidinol-phosphatase (PHP family)
MGQMIVDYHIHSKFSPDGSGDIADFIQEARKKRIDEIGFSEHVILHDQKGYPHRSLGQTEDYIEQFIRIKRDSAMPIKLGAEIDFFWEDVEKIKEFILKHPFDYVIGSVHYLGDWAVDSPLQKDEYKKRDISEIYEDYFLMIEKLCNSKLFDILGHADKVKIFGFKLNRDLKHLLEKTAEVISETGICVEINTSGLKEPCAEIYPSKTFLALLMQNQVPITFGSDAHRPSEVGRSFDQAVKLVKEVGYGKLCTFEKRRKKTETISY